MRSPSASITSRDGSKRSSSMATASPSRFATSSSERSYFPSRIERGETFVAYIDHGYWIDIGTPEKYVQVHRDIMDRRFPALPFRDLPAPHAWIDSGARIEAGATIEGPCFIDEGVLVKPGARIGRYSVVGRQCHIEEDARVEGAIVWQNSRIGRSVSVNSGTVLGDRSALTDYTRV